MLKQIINKKIFYSILTTKILLLFLFSSEYSRNLFQPFVHIFYSNSFNPWEYYINNNLDVNAFPYHSLMLYILTPFSFLYNTFEIFGLFKIPLLLSDLVILFILLKIFPNREKKIFLFYFINPIIIYSIYIHSQLDIIPTSLLFLAIYLLIQKKYLISSFIIGCALAAKFHIIIAIPLILYYLYKNSSIKFTIKYLLIVVVTFLLFDLPFLFSDGFQNMVFLNPKQTLLFDSFYSIGEVKLLLPISVILTVYFHFFNQNKVNNDLLFFYFGLLFTVTIFFIYPAPAWYVWMIPFIAIYFIQHNNHEKSLLLYSFFSISYVVFFVFFYKSDYSEILFLNTVVNFKIINENLQNLSFTFLEVILLSIIYTFYKYGIKSNSIYKKQTNLTIGVGGDSGVGKSTLLKNLDNLLGDKLIRLEGDGEHKWERGDKNWSNFTHLDPKANHIHKQAESILKLKNNQVTYRSEYNHDTGKFTKPLRIIPKEFIVIAGLHPFYLPKLRKNIDLKIYIDTDEDLRRHWKIIRDTKSRGYSIKTIIEQIETRAEDTTKYIYPQKEFSDLIIKYFPIDKFTLGDENKNISLGLKITLDANIHLESIVEELNGIVHWDYNEDLESQYLVLNDVPNVDFESLAMDMIENISEIVQSEINWSKGYEGLIELILLIMISEKLKEDKN